jgi:hypothetical protein
MKLKLILAALVFGSISFLDWARAELPVPAQRVSKDFAEILSRMNQPDFSKTCSDQERNQAARLPTRFRCIQDVCSSYFARYPSPVDEPAGLAKKIGSLRRDYLSWSNSGEIAKLRKGILAWAKALEEEVENKKAPSLSEDELVVAGLRLARTDCEEFPCSDGVKRVVALYEKRQADAQKQMSQQLAAPSGFLRGAIEKLKRDHPAIYEAEKRRLDLFNDMAEKLSPAQMKLVLTEVLTLQDFTETKAAKEELLKVMPSLKEAWAGQHREFAALAANVDSHLNACLDHMAARLAMDPLPLESTAFKLKHEQETKKRIGQMLARNFSAQSSRALSSALALVSVEPSNRSKTSKSLEKFIQDNAQLWSQPLPQGAKELRLGAYQLRFPYWLKEHCLEESAFAGDSSYYAPGAPHIVQKGIVENNFVQLSSSSIRRGETGVLSHELMHAVSMHFFWEQRGEKQFKDFTLSSPSLARKKVVDACLLRKHGVNEPLETEATLVRSIEDFGDLGYVSGENFDPTCNVIGTRVSDRNRMSQPLDDGMHSSAMFRLLHVKSYEPKGLPASCQEYLALEGVPHLFDEKCINQ